jgi:hypothetical protein
MPPVHLDQMLRYCGALTQVTGQSTVFMNGVLAAVEGDIDNHPTGVPGGLNMATGLGALSQLTGLNINALGGLSNLSGLSGLSGLTGMTGLTSMLGGLGISIPNLSSSLSSIGSLSGSGININSLDNIGSIASSIGSVTGISIGGGGDLSQLNNIASSITSGGLSNLGSLSGLSGIAGIGSLGNYLGLAQGVLDAGGNMQNMANALMSAAGASGGPGALISRYGDGSIYINGLKMIVAMGDTSAPDILNGILHPFCPTDPAQGSQSVFAYGGRAGGGLGNILGGNLNIGELVSIGGQVVGQVKNFINIGNGQASAVIQNMGSQTPQAGQTLVGQDSGNSLTLTNFERSNAYDYANTSVDYTEVMIVAVTDDAGVIAVDQHFTGKPSQDYNSNYVVTTE